MDPLTPPLLVSWGARAVGINGAVKEESVHGLAVGSEVVKVQVDLEPGGTIVRQTRLLSRRQAAKAHVERFRYLVVAMRRDVCLKHIEGYDRSGVLILDVPLEGC
jgi:hypothetical protein